MADVMLVDDDGELIQSVTRVLSLRLSPRVLCAAGSVLMALQVAEREKPLVAVIDLCIDEKQGVESGFKLLTALQARDPSMRVLVLTGHGSTSHGIRAMQLGAASFVEKPADPIEIVLLISQKGFRTIELLKPMIIQQERTSDGFKVKLSASHLGWIIRCLVSSRGSIEVISPVSLRVEMEKICRKTLGNYSR